MDLTGRSGALTCRTCGVLFHDSDVQRDHYRSDWHRYNLKRKVVSLPSITAEEFARRADAQAELQAQAESGNSHYCTVCKKSYSTEKACKSHLVSKKHLMEVKAQSGRETEEQAVTEDTSLQKKGKKQVKVEPKPIVQIQSNAKKSQPVEIPMDEDDDDEDEDWEEMEGDPVPITTCLFCEVESDDVDSNLEHMSSAHSFFIPDMEYCINVEGLLEYLGSKVGEGWMCLWCNERGRSFFSLKAAQQHMRDKGHCKMLHDGETQFEYTDYYDYSSSYPDDETANADEAYQPERLEYNDNLQLVLPSGIVLGHRALKIYYKQYIRPGSEVALHRSTKRNRILNHYRAIGYAPSDTVAAQQKFRDQKYLKSVRDKIHVKIGVKGNKTLQHHFRGQVQF